MKLSYRVLPSIVRPRHTSITRPTSPHAMHSSAMHSSPPIGDIAASLDYRVHQVIAARKPSDGQIELWYRASAPLLKPGDIVAGIADTLPVSKDENEQVRRFFSRYGLGFEPSHLVGHAYNGRAGSAEEMAHELMRQAALPGVKMLWPYKGGGGEELVAPYLDRHHYTLPEGMLVCGFSHHTAFGMWAATAGGRAINGAQGVPLSTPGFPSSLVDGLMGGLMGSNALAIRNIAPINQVAAATPYLKGRLYGGNIGAFLSTINEPYFSPPSSGILLLETTDLPPHEISRQLSAAIQLASYYNMQAILLGAFRFSPEKGSSEEKARGEVEAGITRATKHSPIPVYRTNLIGHGAYNAPTLLGHPCIIARAHDNTHDLVTDYNADHMRTLHAKLLRPPHRAPQKDDTLSPLSSSDGLWASHIRRQRSTHSAALTCL